MNLTGPLPKQILSPATVSNQPKGKTKHSHYFENLAQQEMMPMAANMNQGRLSNYQT